MSRGDVISMIFISFPPYIVSTRPDKSIVSKITVGTQYSNINIYHENNKK